MSWIIVQIENGQDTGLSWSNVWGWTTDDFDVFTDAERNRLRLPIGGQWFQIGTQRGERPMPSNPRRTKGH